MSECLHLIRCEIHAALAGVCSVVYKLGLWGHLHPSKAPTPQGTPNHSLESVKPNLKTLGSQKYLPIHASIYACIYANTQEPQRRPTTLAGPGSLFRIHVNEYVQNQVHVYVSLQCVQLYGCPQNGCPHNAHDTCRQYYHPAKCE